MKMLKQYRPRLTRYELALILTDMDSQDYSWKRDSKHGVVRQELKDKLDNAFKKLRIKNMVVKKWKKI